MQTDRVSTSDWARGGEKAARLLLLDLRRTIYVFVAACVRVQNSI